MFSSYVEDIVNIVDIGFIRDIVVIGFVGDIVDRIVVDIGDPLHSFVTGS